MNRSLALDGDFVVPETREGAVTATATHMTINGRAVVRLHDKVAPHGNGEHAAATMKEATSGLSVQGQPVCRDGDAASCGHRIKATATTGFSRGE
jgi:uncharacterized Zn-binding protein involved in type VI secretion